MKNIYLNIYKPNLTNLKKAKKNIENNNVIGIPTETVYGLAGNAYSDISVKKIFSLKKRPAVNPLIIHFKNLSHLKKDAVCNDSFTKLYKALLDKFTRVFANRLYGSLFLRTFFLNGILDSFKGA